MTDLAGNVSYCHVHHIHETIPLDAWVVCGECGHAYRTAQDLVDSWNRREDEWVERNGAGAGDGQMTLAAADRVFSCVECGHDF